MRGLTEIIGYAVWLLGIPALVRRLTRRRAAILLYHDPDPSVFEAHLQFLRRHYRCVPFADVVRVLKSGAWSELPEHAVVLHLDDGYRRNVELLDVCVRHDTAPTLYLCSHVVGTHRRFWSKLAGGRSKRLRLVNNRELLEKLNDEAGYTPQREYPEREALSAQELDRLASRFDFQSHGRYHFSLLTLDDAELDSDLAESRARIESMTGSACRHFSFPYGDFGPRELEAVKRAGYETARTTGPGWVGPRTDPYRLPIVADVPGHVSVNVLRLHLTGLPRVCKRAAYLLVTQHIHAAVQRASMSRRFFGKA
jgi:peptidoglycan/xylan/chitin deacetylase (PgdA/CDA1 family)